MKFFSCKSRMVALAVGLSAGFSILASCGGGGNNTTTYQLTEGDIYHFVVGPATSAEPAEIVLQYPNNPLNYYTYVVPLDQLFTISFVVGPNLHGQVVMDAETWFECVYSTEGNMNEGKFNLSISWNALTGYPQNITLNQITLTPGTVNGTVDDWRVATTFSFDVPWTVVRQTRQSTLYGSGGVVNKG